jgi:hypothetical protein
VHERYVTEAIVREGKGEVVKITKNLNTRIGEAIDIKGVGVWAKTGTEI